MAVLLAYSARLVIKRSLQRQHSLPSSARRQKSNVPERPSEKSSQPLTQVSGKSLSTVRELSPQPFWERLGPLSEAFGAYARTQRRRPWATQIGTSLVVYLCGDLVAQKIDGEAYDPSRTLRHLTIGAICSIPAYSWWAADRFLTSDCEGANFRTGSSTLAAASIILPKSSLWLQRWWSIRLSSLPYSIATSSACRLCYLATALPMHGKGSGGQCPLASSTLANYGPQ